HPVTNLRFAVLVVDHEGRRPAARLAVEAVTHLPLDGHDDALLHLVTDHDADLLGFLGHPDPQTSSSTSLLTPPALPEDGLDARQVAARGSHLCRRLELAH